MSRRLGLIQIAASAAALALCVWWALRQRPPHIPTSASAVGWILLGLALYALGTVLRAERWRRILHLNRVNTGRKDAYGLITVCYMGNNVLPARAGEALRVFLLGRRGDTGMRKVAGTVIAERILDALVLAVMLVSVVYAVLPAHALPTNRPLLIVGVGVVVVVVGAIGVQLIGRRRLLQRLRDLARPLADAPRMLLSRAALPLLGITIVLWLVEAAVFEAVGRGLGINLDPFQAIYLVSLANFFAAVPAAPGSLGTFEAAVAFGLTALSIHGNSVSYILALRLIVYGPITVVGLVVLFARYGGWKFVRERRRKVEAPAVSQA